MIVILSFIRVSTALKIDERKQKRTVTDRFFFFDNIT